MMDILLLPVYPEDIPNFKRDMQVAFQKGAESEFGSLNIEVLPEDDIECSLREKDAAAYKAVVDGRMVGGAVVVVDKVTQRGHLDFLYVKYGIQGQGAGKEIWKAIEELYPEIRVWETCTPYFEKRNIHFYVNCCGFHIVEYLHQGHPDPNEKGTEDGKEDGGMFRFEKIAGQKNEQ